MISALRDTTTTSNPFATATTPPVDPPVGPAEPSTGSPTALSDASKGLGRDEFLKLLVAQLKNQDPLNPMDGKDMAAQLAQFSSVEQLIQMNKEVASQGDAQQKMVDALGQLGEDQKAQGDELAQLIEGQMAVSTVGKVGVTTGNQVFVDREGNGALTIDAGTLSGGGRATILDANGITHIGTVANVNKGMQSIDLRDVTFDPPLKPGTAYTFRFDVTPEGGASQAVKTYTTGRITGLKYDNGNPVLVIGDGLSVPFSQLIQIRS